VDDPQWFYRNDDEWNAFVEQLKYTACPHCKVVGALIQHGFLYGFDENHTKQQTHRAHRIFCSNRQELPGCGHTFSVWLADTIRRLSLTAAGLWRFLHDAVADGILAAIRDSTCHLSHRTLRRLWRRFRHGQSHIRTTLAERCPPPQLPSAHRPEAQTLAHLQAAFPDAPCPIAAFQHTLRTFFV
jgi:hypothetical protein